MIRYTLHVPLVDNDGSPTPDAVTAAVESELLDAIGGYTRTEGIGGWRGDDGRTHREPIALYAVDIEPPTFIPNAARGLLLTLADYLRDVLDQDAIYLTESPIVATLVIGRRNGIVRDPF